MQRRDHDPATFGILIVFAALFHLAGAAALVPIARYFEHREEQRRVMTSEVELEVPPPPPPEPTTPPEPTVQPSAAPEPVRPAPRAEAARQNTPEPQPSAPPPAPPPTQAAPLMVVPDEFSNDNQDTVATGNNVNATGDTSSDGVVREPGDRVTGARIGGTGNGPGTGTGPAPAPSAPAEVDLAQRAEFSCDESALAEFFPDAAREAGITQMRVRVRLTIDESGRVTNVTALNDPGYGFAASAVRMLRSSHCTGTAARDRSGRAVTDTRTRPIEFTLE